MTQSDRLARWFTAPPARTAAFSRVRRPGVVLRVSQMRAEPPSAAASAKRRVSVATPERWQRKFSAVRSAVRIGASGPGDRAEHLARRRRGRRRAADHVHVDAGVELGERLRGAGGAGEHAGAAGDERRASAAAPAGSSAEVRSPSGVRSSARAAGDGVAHRERGRDRRRPSGSAEAAAVLLERGVDRERRRPPRASAAALERAVDLHHVVVGRGEHGLGQALPRLGDAGDLVALRVGDGEVPGPPVLGVDRSRASAPLARSRSKRILPIAFCCTIEPISLPVRRPARAPSTSRAWPAG